MTRWMFAWIVGAAILATVVLVLVISLLFNISIFESAPFVGLLLLGPYCQFLMSHPRLETVALALIISLTTIAYLLIPSKTSFRVSIVGAFFWVLSGLTITLFWNS